MTLVSLIWIVSPLLRWLLVFLRFEIWFFVKCYVIYLGIVKSWKRRKREEKKSGVRRERFFFWVLGSKFIDCFGGNSKI
jgi:hypothetical protein